MMAFTMDIACLFALFVVALVVMLMIMKILFALIVATGGETMVMAA